MKNFEFASNPQTVGQENFDELAGRADAVDATIMGLSVAGPVPGSGLTMNSARLLGRGSDGVGPIEELELGTGLDLTAGVLSVTVVGGEGGAGTVTVLTAGTLAPLFTTAVDTGSTTPALSFALTDAALNRVFAGPATGGAGAPTYRQIVAADIASLPGHSHAQSEVTGLVSALGVLTTGLAGLVSDLAALVTTVAAKALGGAIGSSGLTMTTARLLGRSTGGSGPVEEITVGTGLTLASGVLTGSGGSGLTFAQVNYLSAGAGEDFAMTFNSQVIFSGGGTPAFQAASTGGTALAVGKYLVVVSVRYMADSSVGGQINFWMRTTDGGILTTARFFQNAIGVYPNTATWIDVVDCNGLDRIEVWAQWNPDVSGAGAHCFSDGSSMAWAKIA